MHVFKAWQRWTSVRHEYRGYKRLRASCQSEISLATLKIYSREIIVYFSTYNRSSQAARPDQVEWLSVSTCRLSPRPFCPLHFPICRTRDYNLLISSPLSLSVRLSVCLYEAGHFKQDPSIFRVLLRIVLYVPTT